VKRYRKTNETRRQDTIISCGALETDGNQWNKEERGGGAFAREPCGALARAFVLHFESWYIPTIKPFIKSTAFP
jgi:hypothetical protein